MKTLKDLDTYDMDGRLSEEFKEFVEYDDLKQEAIKWVKFIESTTFNRQYMFEGLESSNGYSINWIKHFFNITKKDLN